MDRTQQNPSEVSLPQILREIAQEVKDFFHTRIEMLRSELYENWVSWKNALPLAAGALLLLVTSYFLFTAAAVALVAGFLPPGTFRWVVALAIIGFLWGLPGIWMASSAFRKLRQPPLIPRKTVEVLKADKEALKNEVKAA